MRNKHILNNLFRDLTSLNSNVLTDEEKIKLSEHLVGTLLDVNSPNIDYAKIESILMESSLQFDFLIKSLELSLMQKFNYSSPHKSVENASEETGKSELSESELEYSKTTLELLNHYEENVKTLRNMCSIINSYRNKNQQNKINI